MWNEAFLNVSDESNNDQGLMERNRAFIGVQVPLGKTKIETGYLNQTVFRGVENVFEHLAVVYWMF